MKAFMLPFKGDLRDFGKSQSPADILAYAYDYPGDSLNSALTAAIPTPDKRKILGVLRAADKLIAGNLRGIAPCKKPYQCAVGELLFAAGVSGKELVAMSKVGSDVPSIPLKHLQLLFNRYGLLPDTLYEIMDGNDSSDVSTPEDDDLPDGICPLVSKKQVIARVKEVLDTEFEDIDTIADKLAMGDSTYAEIVGPVIVKAYEGYRVARLKEAEQEIKSARKALADQKRKGRKTTKAKAKKRSR